MWRQGSMKKIILLWPTARPQVMRQTHLIWHNRAVVKPDILIAVNTPEQQSQLLDFGNVLVVGDNRKGPAYPTFVLGKEVDAKHGDILILVSDDFYPPDHWDEYLRSAFESYSGSILVNDGHQFGGCMTIPIMDYACLLKLNRIIYHSDYNWQYADTELFLNLSEMGLLRDLRLTSPVFEHRHWANGKRVLDEVDVPGARMRDYDILTWERRSKLSLIERLK